MHVRDALGRVVRSEISRALQHVRHRLLSRTSGRAETGRRAPEGGAQGDPVPEAVETSTLVDLNSAAREELMTLPGIGPARADAIVAGRPYTAEEDLVERRIVPERVFDEIESLVRVSGGTVPGEPSRGVGASPPPR